MAAAFFASLPMSDTLWLTTAELCEHLAISRSTLFAIRRSGLLKDGRLSRVNQVDVWRQSG